jgi:hypothetical protein
MQTILDTLRKSLSQQHRGNKMIGTIAIVCVRKFFQLEKAKENTVREKEILDGYIRNNKLFIKTSDQALKIDIFKKKAELINLVNQHLASLNYHHKIDDVFLK